jgi:hypothetical protein
MKKSYHILVLLLLIFILFSCKNTRHSEAEHILEEWIGKNIEIPNIKPVIYSLKHKNITKYTVTEEEKEYKILLYIDSTGCTSCKLRLSLWMAFIEEVCSKVDFLFYFHLKSEEEVVFLLKQDMFIYPVYIDKNNDINKLNNFPSKIHYQCFLLDNSNKIIAIGNPVHNFQIWDLYKQIVIKEISDKPLVTTVEPDHTVIELSDLHINKTSEAIFTLKNTGTNPLVIQMVNASCGCTVPEWEKQPIAVGSSTEIKVKITPETSGYFNKMITVHCNTEAGQVSFIVRGTVKD